MKVVDQQNRVAVPECKTTTTHMPIFIKDITKIKGFLGNKWRD